MIKKGWAEFWKFGIVLILTGVILLLPDVVKCVYAELPNHYIILIDESGSMRHRFRYIDKKDKVRIVENERGKESRKRRERIENILERTKERIKSGDAKTDLPAFREGTDYLTIAQFGLSGDIRIFDYKKFINTLKNDSNLDIKKVKKKLTFHKEYGYRSLAISSALKYFGNTRKLETGRLFSRLFIYIIGDKELNIRMKLDTDEIIQAESGNKNMDQARYLKDMEEEFYLKKFRWKNFERDQLGDVICKGNYCFKNRYDKKPTINRGDITAMASVIEVQEIEMVPKIKRQLLEAVEFPSSDMLKLVPNNDDSVSLRDPLVKKTVSICTFNNKFCQRINSSDIKFLFIPEPTLSSVKHGATEEIRVFWNNLTFGITDESFKELNRLPGRLADKVKQLEGQKYTNYTQFKQNLLSIFNEEDRNFIGEIVKSTYAEPVQMSIKFFSKDPLYGKIYFEKTRNFSKVKFDYGYTEVFPITVKEKVYVYIRKPYMLETGAFILGMAFLLLVFYVTRKPRFPKGDKKDPFTNTVYPE